MQIGWKFIRFNPSQSELIRDDSKSERMRTYFPILMSRGHQLRFVRIKELGGFRNFKKSIFFCLFDNTICLEYSLLYGAGIGDSM